MKKISEFFLLVLIMISLCGCAKLIDTQYSTVNVKIVDECYRGSYVSPVVSGKTTTFITHPAVYKITVEYNDVDYVISGRDKYIKYSEKIGEYTTGTLETRRYDDGTVRYNITELN